MQPRQLVVAIVALVVGGLAAWVFWPDPAPRQREYLDATACLLTDAKGVAGTEAAPIWSAMQDASVSSLVRVQYLEVDGPQTAGDQPVGGPLPGLPVDGPQPAGSRSANGPQVVGNLPPSGARSYAASLAGRGCGVVIAVGTAQVEAVTATAPAFPAVRFVTVGGGKPSANVSVVEASDLATIGQRVSALADEKS